MASPGARDWPTNWRGVFFDGPEADQDYQGDEIPVWTLYVGDQNANPTLTVYRLYAFDAATNLARQMSQDRHIELVQDATPV